MKAITVLLADDHTIVREGLRLLLQLETDITVVGEARHGREAVALAKEHRPDVVIMDLAMPLLNGLAATQQILAALPATKIIILSAHSGEPYIERVLALGALGFLIKQTSAQCLSKAIREVAQGRTFFSPSIARRLQAQAGAPPLARLPNRKDLTAREMEVLQSVAEGAPNKKIATDMGISISTVEKHRQHLMDKLNIHDTAGLTRYAIAHGLVECALEMTIIESETDGSVG